MPYDYSRYRDRADEVPFEKVFYQIGLVFGPGVNAFGRTQSWSLWQCENQDEPPDQTPDYVLDRIHTGSLPPLSGNRFHTSPFDFLIRSHTSSPSFSPTSRSSSPHSQRSSTIKPTPAGTFSADLQLLEYYGDQYYRVILQYFLATCIASMSWPMNGAGSLGPQESLARLEGYSIEDLLQPASIPIASVAEVHLPAHTGVLMISNIPYTVTRQEIATFIGRSARTLPTNQGCPIHIMMERSTGKTMDCFVEFVTKKDAKDTVDRINRNHDIGSAPRIGSRHVDVELSTPAKMMKAIFPLTKCIEWEDGKPVLLENEFSWSTGFTGFLTDEELFCLNRHAEQPHRSAFASKVPQRCYEFLITTILKFPWYATDLYTVDHRNKLFLTMRSMIKALVDRIRKQKTVGLDARLLQELVQTGIACPAFNPRMKYCFAWWSENPAIIQSLDHDWCLYFPFDTLNYVPGHDPIDIQFYAFLMSHGCVSIPKADGLMNQHGHPDLLRLYGKYFFEWSEEVSEELLFKDAIIYEARIFRQFIITGFQRNRGRQLSISTIGTAPSSSSIQDDGTDSERTVVTVTQPVFRPRRSVSPETVIQVNPQVYQVNPQASQVNPKASQVNPQVYQVNPQAYQVNPQASQVNPQAYQVNPQASQVNPQASQVNPRASGSIDFIRNWTFPHGSPGVSGQAIANPTVPESPTPRPAAERIQPYRPPHARNAAGSSNSRMQRGRGSRQSHQAAGSSISRMPPPTYYAPHATAHNIHSSSNPDPFDATRPMAPASQRSISDASRHISNVDGMRAARRPGAAKK